MGPSRGRNEENPGSANRGTIAKRGRRVLSSPAKNLLRAAICWRRTVLEDAVACHHGRQGVNPCQATVARAGAVLPRGVGVSALQPTELTSKPLRPPRRDHDPDRHGPCALCDLQWSQVELTPTACTPAERNRARKSFLCGVYSASGAAVGAEVEA